MPGFHSEDCGTITRATSTNIQGFSQEVGGPKGFSEVCSGNSRNFTGVFSRADPGISLGVLLSGLLRNVSGVLQKCTRDLSEVSPVVF